MKATPKPQIPTYLHVQCKNLPTKSSITPSNLNNKTSQNISTENTLTHHLVSKHTQHSLQIEPFIQSQEELAISKYSKHSKANVKVLKPKKSNKVRSEISQDSLAQKYSSLCNEKLQNSYYNDNQQLSLYQKSLRSYSAKKSWLNRQHRKQQMKEIEQCTYNPKINMVSQEIIKKKKCKNKQSQIKDNKNGSINAYIKQKKQKQLLQCSFVPKINDKKRKLLTNSVMSQLSQNIFENLYKESIARENRKRNLSNSYYEETCKNPRINKISKSIMGQSKFSQRLQQYQQSKDMKTQKRIKTENVIEKNMYQPKIGRPPMNYNKENLPIGQYLYQKSKNIKNKNQNLKNKPSFVNKKSEQFYQKSKRQAFQKIYDLLDEDNIGYVSLLTISLINIPMELLQTLRPLLQELQILDTYLTRQQFILSLNNLFNTLPVSSKNIILKQSKIKNQIQQHSFQPFLNSKSLNLANCMVRGKMNIHQYCEMKKLNSQLIVKQIRQQRVRKQMEECTFHPKVNEYY